MDQFLVLTSVLDGFIPIFTIVFWNYTIDWASSHFRSIERLSMLPSMAWKKYRTFRPRSSKEAATPA